MSPESRFSLLMRRRPSARSMKIACVGAILAALVIMSVVSMALATDTVFPDVEASHPHYGAIQDLAAREIVNGKADGRFYPDEAVMRQQFAKMIVKTLELEVPADIALPFVDVDPNPNPVDPLYPAKYVAVCALHGITVGKTATTFDPYSGIQRWQVLTMVVRAADALRPGVLAPPTGAFTPTWDPALSPEHGDNAARAEYNGLLTGIDLAGLDPFGGMTRGEIAQVLHNLSVKLAPVTTTTTTTEVTTTTSTTSTTSTTTPTTVVVQTIDKGEISSYRYGDATFAGADMAIGDGTVWSEFWDEHTAGVTPPPSLPEVDFAEEMVIVTILGYQTSGAGPSTEILGAELDGDTLRVRVADNRTPGMLTVITNPFHIVKVPKAGVSQVVFEHVSPNP